MHAAVWYIMDIHAQVQRIINHYNNPSEISSMFNLNLSNFPQDQSALLFRSGE